jgi:hypothetical protein
MYHIYIFFPEELPLNTHPSKQKALSACYNAQLLIRYIFSFNNSKTKYEKKKKKVGFGGEGGWCAKKEEKKKDNNRAIIQHSSGRIYHILSSFLSFIGDLNLQKPLN